MIKLCLHIDVSNALAVSLKSALKSDKCKVDFVFYRNPKLKNSLYNFLCFVRFTLIQWPKTKSKWIQIQNKSLLFEVYRIIVRFQSYGQFGYNSAHFMFVTPFKSEKTFLDHIKWHIKFKMAARFKANPKIPPTPIPFSTWIYKCNLNFSFLKYKNLPQDLTIRRLFWFWRHQVVKHWNIVEFFM